MSEKVCAIMIEKVCANCYFKGKTQEDYPPARCGSCIDYCWWKPRDYQPTDYRMVVAEETSDDQKAKADAGKLDPTLVPTKAIMDCALVRTYGNLKYGSRDNWKQVSVERYTAALYRHLLAFIDDKHSVDEESGIPHYKHLLCNACFISALMED